MLLGLLVVGALASGRNRFLSAFVVAKSGWFVFWLLVLRFLFAAFNGLRDLPSCVARWGERGVGTATLKLDHLFPPAEQQRQQPLSPETTVQPPRGCTRRSGWKMDDCFPSMHPGETDPALKLPFNRLPSRPEIKSCARAHARLRVCPPRLIDPPNLYYINHPPVKQQQQQQMNGLRGGFSRTRRS